MTPSRLTEADCRRIGEAEGLRAVTGSDAVRTRTGEADPGMAYAVAYGEAREVIGDLLAIISRLAGGDAPCGTEGGRR